MKHKFAFIIAEVRQIDYYYNFLLKHKSEDIVVIINDSDQQVGCEIKNDPRLHYFKTACLSEVIEKKIVFPVVVSTGNFKVPVNNISFRGCLSVMKSALKFTYARTIGIVLQYTGLSKQLENILGRPFDAGGLRRRLILKHGKYIERDIGQKTIMYPRGLDINVASYPNKDVLNRFDAFMCHGNLDQKVIASKTQKPTYLIGYPRYENDNIDQAKKDAITNEFCLSTEKKTILWMPSRLDWEFPNYQNILDWLDILNEDTLPHQVILRPHPHCLQQDPNLLNILNSYKCRIDTKRNRELGLLYHASDLVICDYGGSLFSATYTEKPVVLLNSKNHANVSKSNESDTTERHKFRQFDITNKTGLLNFLIELDTDTLHGLRVSSVENKKRFFFGEQRSIDNSISESIFDL